LIAYSVVGCTSNKWTKPHFDRNEFQKDREQCLRSIDRNLVSDAFGKALEECLAEKGYKYHQAEYKELQQVQQPLFPVPARSLTELTTTDKVPPEELRADLGRIGIVSVSFQPEVRFQKPMTKEAAAGHMAGEAALGLLKGAGGIGGYGGLVILALVPVGAVVGSIVGAVMGVSPEKIKETEDTLNGCLATVNFQETMLERFLKTVAREQIQYPFILLEVRGPNGLDEEVTYGSLSDKGIDTILEIGLPKCQLWGGRRGVNPPLDFLMAVRIRLIRTTDGHVLFSRNFVYDNDKAPLKLSKWAVNNARRFREELDRAFQYLALEMVGAVYMIQTPPPDPQSTE